MSTSLSDLERSSGVQELIDRLRAQGVEEGQQQAEAIVAEARRRAAELLDQAKAEAEKTVERARGEAKQLQAAGEEALRLAGRDAVLALKAALTDRFRSQLRRLVTKALADEAFLEKLILSIAGRTVPQGAGQELEILLPEQVVSVESLRQDPEGARQSSLGKFVAALAGDMVRQGISFSVSDEHTAGIVVKVAGEDLNIQLDDQAVGALLLKHLLPRFRALMEGAV